MKRLKELETENDRLRERIAAPHTEAASTFGCRGFFVFRLNPADLGNGDQPAPKAGRELPLGGTSFERPVTEANFGFFVKIESTIRLKLSKA